jgi:hypothetical protein
MILYLLSGRYVDMFAFGMVNKRAYQCMCAIANQPGRSGAGPGFKTIEGRRHGEWLIGCYSTSYHEGVMISWRKYIVPVPCWCLPPLVGLDRSWQLGKVHDPHYPHHHDHQSYYSTLSVYVMGVVQYVGLVSPSAPDEIIKKYDWCTRCSRLLSVERAGAQRCPNIIAIEQFLAQEASADECPNDCTWHDIQN